jgi:dTDP-4-amino-4,6-dideoxygalactose transaminase
VLGPEVEGFEQDFAAYLGASYCVGVASGTDALELALRALGVGPGDEVVVPALTAPATAAAVLRAGAAPVLADVDAESLLLDPERAAEALGPRVRAVVPVHLYGRAAPVEPLLALGPDVVEDAAQAHGLRLPGGAAGTLGRAGCFSFYPTKNLGALGDGGAIVTGDPVLAERVRRLRQYGEDERYRSVETGVNSRLDELQAAFLRAGLELLDEGNARRARIAAAYDEALGRPSPPGVNHLYVVRHRERDRLREELAGHGIGTLVHYPYALHEQPAFAACRRGSSLAESERGAREVLSLPCYPELTDAEVEAVCAALALSAV